MWTLPSNCMLRYVDNAMRLTDYSRPLAGIVKPGIAQVLTTLGDMAVRRRA